MAETGLPEWDAGYEVPAGVSLPGLLRRRFALNPSAAAVHIGGASLSYGDLGRHVFGTASALRALGLGEGSRIATFMPNTATQLGVWLACAELGAVLVPVNALLTGDTLRYVLGHARAEALIVDRALFSTYGDAFGEQAPAERVLAAGGDLPGALRLERLIELADGNAGPLPAEDPGAPALIIYTSGTTGRPKGVVLSRAAQLAHGWYYGKDFVRLGPGECSYTCLPLFHVTSMGFSLGTLLGGAAVAIDPSFSPFSFWARVRHFRARIFPFLGAMIAMLAARPRRADDAAVPATRAIGAAVPVDLWEAFEQRFGLRLIETYGQTELASLWFMPPEDGGRVGTIGKPAPRLRARVTGVDGAPAADGVPGELMLQPADRLLMFSEYFRDGEATRDAYRNGWYATGDACSRDADGFYRFEGRLKEFIRRRGENISAFEVEREALTHPAAREAAAVGVPSPLGDEEIKLCVLLQEGAALSPAELHRYLRPRLAGFMLPRFLEVYDEFPRTATQRVQKFKLVEDGVRATTWERGAYGPGS